MRTKLILTIIFLVTSLTGVQAYEWVSLDRNPIQEGGCISKEIIQDDASAYTARFNIHAISNESLELREGKFQKISFGDIGHLSDIGSPELPYLNQFIAIPEGAGVNFSIEEERWTDIEIGTILPVQKPVIEGEARGEFIQNQASYGRSFIPRLVQMGSEMEWRGIRCAGIHICPFKYYPAEGRLSVLSEFTLHIEFQAGKLPTKRKPVYENADPLHLFDNDIFTQSAKSTASLPSYSNTLNSPNGKLLIIVGSGLSQIYNSKKLDEFCKWKVFKGFPVEVVTTSATGTEPSSIKSYIYQKYVNDGVRYVLFVGDVGEIPLYEIPAQYLTGNIQSDYWYGCMGGDGNYVADIAVGRFCTDNYYEFANMVDKSIRYERKYHATNDVLLVSHKYGAIALPSYQSCCEDIRTANYSTPMNFITAYGSYVSTGGDDATNEDVVNYINQGAHIINYRGHGETDFWGSLYDGQYEWNTAGEAFDTSQVEQMNDDTDAIFFSVACNTANIGSNTVSMLEAFTRSNHGAVAFIGATKETEMSLNDDYDKALFIRLLNYSNYRIGDLNVAAHKRCIDSAIYKLGTYDNANSYILGGDPTLEIWTAEPQHLSVDFALSGSTYTLMANVNTGFNMCVIEDSYWHRLNLYSSYNQVSFSKPYFNFYAVVNKHNYFPYIIYGDFNTNLLTHKEYDYDAYYYNTPITIEEGVDEEEGSWEGVTVKSGSKLSISNGTGGVIINNTFECEKGASFEIK